MLCPCCHHDETRVIDSRASAENSVRRRRECLKCRRRFTTYEKAEQASLKVIKKDGTRVSFDREKLRVGIAKACHKRPIAVEKIDQLVADIESEVLETFEREVPSHEIGERVSNSLKELDDVAYLRFVSVYSEFQRASDFAQELQPILRGAR
jgi:transcriptional repressor NrdR